MQDLATNPTLKAPQDVIFDFADTLAICLGTEENPDHEKALAVLIMLTEMGKQNPVFVRKILSEKFIGKIYEIVPQFQKGKLGMIDLISVGTDLKKTFDNA